MKGELFVRVEYLVPNGQFNSAINPNRDVEVEIDTDSYIDIKFINRDKLTCIKPHAKLIIDHTDILECKHTEICIDVFEYEGFYWVRSKDVKSDI